MNNTADVTGGKPIAVYLRCKCYGGAILLLCPGHHTRQKKQNKEKHLSLSSTDVVKRD
jgi:hypothetical protein